MMVVSGSRTDAHALVAQQDFGRRPVQCTKVLPPVVATAQQQPIDAHRFELSSALAVQHHAGAGKAPKYLQGGLPVNWELRFAI